MTRLFYTSNLDLIDLNETWNCNCLPSGKALFYTTYQFSFTMFRSPYDMFLQMKQRSDISYLSLVIYIRFLDLNLYTHFLYFIKFRNQILNLGIKSLEYAIHEILSHHGWTCLKSNLNTRKAFYQILHLMCLNCPPTN